MLAKRVATALVLLALFLPAIFLAPPWVWGALSLAVLAAAGREWGRLLGSERGGWALGGALVVAGIAYLAWRGAVPAAGAPPLAAGIAVASLAFWVTAGPLALARVRRVGPPWAVAALALGACWIALYELRVAGAVMLVSCMAIVWLADVGAYFAGRGFGRRKLAPRVSPGKTWEGVAGGVALVLATAALVPPLWREQVFSGWMVERGGWVATAVVLVAMVALSVVGDLHESLLKRLAGAKDSGGLLPGHGGVLDRIDALIPTMPGCLLLLQVLR
jgi:phosphatidate cytidylyltransferase